jgi:hypothetical protein
MKVDQLVIRAFTCCTLLMTVACSPKAKLGPESKSSTQAMISYFKVDPSTSASITGRIHYSGKKPGHKLIDMSEDPACAEAHQEKAYDESLLVSPDSLVADTFIYIKKGLEGKNFEVPSTPVVIDQSGCWFHPHVMGIQTNQPLKIVNSDPVTHNIHPMAEINREWNHSQGPGDSPLNRKFIKPEVMIPVKCNIHGWMHAYIGVVDNPYFAVSEQDGSYEIKNLPPGTYTIAFWQEKLGTQEQQITVGPQQHAVANVTFTGK